MLDSPYNDRLLENIPLKLMIKLFSWGRIPTIFDDNDVRRPSEHYICKLHIDIGTIWC